MASHAPARGFTLVETIVATGILVTALAGVAQLFVLGSQLARQGNASGTALRAAQDKLEQLRSLTFGFDEAGQPMTDSRLTPSPSYALTESTELFSEWLDPAGDVIEDDSGAEYVRRWRITPLGVDTPQSIAIEVCVFAATAEQESVDAAHACLSTVRTRQP